MEPTDQKGPYPAYPDSKFTAVVRENSPEPVSASEVANSLGCHVETARDRLERLEEAGDIASKPIGSGLAYWDNR